MKTLLSILLIYLMTLSAFGQSTSGWKVGTITDVRIHENGEKVGASDGVSYDVSVKVGDTIYVVLYTPPLHEETVKYAAGRSGSVLVGKRTIRYNNLLGESFDLPIKSQKPAKSKDSGPVSTGLNK